MGEVKAAVNEVKQQVATVTSRTQEQPSLDATHEVHVHSSVLSHADSDTARDSGALQADDLRILEPHRTDYDFAEAARVSTHFTHHLK